KDKRFAASSAFAIWDQSHSLAHSRSGRSLSTRAWRGNEPRNGLQYLKDQGYTFRKAREVLTSPDPNFREKLAKVQEILSNLGPNERFFSIDELGPCGIRRK